MQHGSRHRRSDHGRGRRERPDNRPAAAPRSGRESWAAKALGATVAVSLAAGVVAVVAAGAVDQGAAATSLSVSPAEDTYVYQEYPDQNRSTSTKLTASNQAGLHTRSYLRFVVKGVPAGVSGLTAHLRFDSDRNQPPLVELHRVASSTWSAATTTIRNAPAVGDTVASVKPDYRQKTLDFDVSAAVTGDGDYSFALTAPLPNTVSVVFASEEGAGGPRLTLDWSGRGTPPSPAPSSAAPSAPALPSMSPVKPTPTPTAKPTPTSSAPSSSNPPPPAVPSGPTLFGATVWAAGQSQAQALAAANSRYGNLEVVRVFYHGLPAPWPGAAALSGGPVVVSFKAAPKDVLSGSVDGQLSSWFANAPKGRPIYWSYFHEPEDDIARGAYTAADYRAAWQHLRALSLKASNPNLRSTLILMGWSLSAQSGRNWKDYYPGSSTIDVLGWDTYNLAAPKGKYNDAATVMGDVVATSRAAGKPWGIAELGSLLVSGDSGAGRAAWLNQMASYAQAQGAAFVTYFDAPVGGEYRLLDAPSQRAWKAVVSG